MTIPNHNQESMSTRPRVTVFIPVYNGQKFIGEAISSILSQTYRDFILIIINDGSTDDTETTILSFDDSRIRLVNHPSNFGIPHTRNHGLALAEGDYLALMDADDISHPNRLAEQVTFLDNNKDIGICGTWYTKFTETKKETVRFPLTHDEIIFHLIFDNCFGQNTVMLRRSFLEKNSLRYDQSFSFSEDYDFWVRCAKYMRLGNLPVTHVAYRFHAENSTNCHFNEMTKYADIVRHTHLEFFDIKPNQTELQLHLDLMNFRFTGDLDRLVHAGEWITSLASAVLKKTSLPPSFVYSSLGRFWYSACGHQANHGYKVWQLFNESPISKHTDPKLKGKLFLRVLYGISIC